MKQDSGIEIQKKCYLNVLNGSGYNRGFHMNNFCTFYIVRHGESENNKAWRENTIKVFKNVDESGSELNEAGISQAKERAKDIKDIKFEAIFSSDFDRAKRTAEIISLGRNLEINTSELLRERYWGDLEGVSIDKIREDIIRLKQNLSDVQKMNFKLVKDAESEEESATRFTTFIRDTAAVYIGKKVLIVTHSNIMRTFLVKVGFGTYAELAPHTIENTGYCILQSDGINFFVKKTVGINKKKIEN